MIFLYKSKDFEKNSNNWVAVHTEKNLGSNYLISLGFEEVDENKLYILDSHMNIFSEPKEWIFTKIFNSVDEFFKDFMYWNASTMEDAYDFYKHNVRTISVGSSILLSITSDRLFPTNVDMRELVGLYFYKNKRFNSLKVHEYCNISSYEINVSNLGQYLNSITLSSEYKEVIVDHILETESTVLRFTPMEDSLKRGYQIKGLGEYLEITKGNLVTVLVTKTAVRLLCKKNNSEYNMSLSLENFIEEVQNTSLLDNFYLLEKTLKRLYTS